MRPLTSPFAILLVAVATLLAGCVSETGEEGDGGTNGTEPPPARNFEVVREATVQIIGAVVDDDGEVIQEWIGTGSVVDPSGLILTNAHVAAPEAPGLEILYALTPSGSLERTNPNLLVIGMYTAEDQLPDFRYLAEVMTADGWLDLAILRIVSDIDRNPVSELDLPTLALGDSDSLQGRDELTVIGYPDVGGETISTAPGVIGGFLPDEKIDGLNRGWIKTTATIRGGNSGGVGVNQDLQLIGVPTRGGADFGHLRPINIAKPLIADAKMGRTYMRGTGIVNGSGQESLSLIGFSPEVEEDGCLVDPATNLPSGISVLNVGFEWSGFVDGQDVAWLWIRDGQPWFKDADFPDGWRHGPSGSCVWISAVNSDGSVLPNGAYEIKVYAGETLRLIGNEKATVGLAPVPDGVVLEVQVLDTDSRAPISGATVGVLVPGTDPRAWSLANPRDESRIVATAVSVAGKFVSLNNSVEPGVDYPWFVLPPSGSGYREVLWGCCLNSDTNTKWNLTITKPVP